MTVPFPQRPAWIEQPSTTPALTVKAMQRALDALAEERAQFPDDPVDLCRVLLACCPPDTDVIYASLVRVLALIDLIDHPLLDKWSIPNGPEDRMIHPAIVRSAAVLSVNERGQFEVEAFVAAVERCAAGMRHERHRSVLN